MKRTGFKKLTYTEALAKKVAKVRVPAKKPAKRKIEGKKRRKKTPLKKLKERLWQLCREIQINKYGRNCYTCGKQGLEGKNCHLGHFIPSSTCSTEIRYSLDNLRPCCYHCNINLSGNWVSYEEHLIQDNGDDFVKKLKIKNNETKGKMYREDWYEAKISEYELLK
jgi:hypothetical protein